MDEKEMWNHVKNLIQSGAPISGITDALSEVTKQGIEDVYEDGNNLLHYAVSTNNLQVARLLFDKECFLPPHESKTVPYLHIACLKGFSDMVELLLEERPDDIKVKVSANDEDWKRLISANSATGDRYEALQANTSSPERKNGKISAHEVAALCQQLTCLKSLLEEPEVEEWPCQLVTLGEPAALEFLLDTMKFDADELSYAFEISLLNSSSQCLEILLKYASENNIFYTLKFNNPYRYLYSPKPTDPQTGMHPLAECTRLLIRYGWDVNVMEVQNTFPLYCLMCRMIGYYETISNDGGTSELKMLDDELACLSELLISGADPNYDEKSSTYSDLPTTDFVAKVAGGQRIAFSSAAEALSTLIHLNVNPSLKEFVSQAASLLAKYGCCMIGQRSWLGSMIEMNEPAGLKMLLDAFEFHGDSLNYGFEASLYHMSPCCLETMLQHAAENNITFRQKNPFHFLYLYTWNKDWLARKSLEECTRALINHGWNVKEMHTAASYPLYSLLWSVTASYSPYTCHVASEMKVLGEAYGCLIALLDAGVDPNFDESLITAPNLAGMSVSAFETRLIRNVKRNYEGNVRRPYSSAAAGLMDMFSSINRFDPYFLGFIAESVTRLVQSGANVTVTNDSGQSLLHRFLNCVSITYDDRYNVEEAIAIKALQNVGQVMRSFMEHGVDINARDCFGKYPLEYFGERLTESLFWFMLDEDRDKELLEPLYTRLKPVFRFVDVMEMEQAQWMVTYFAGEINRLYYRSGLDFAHSVLDSLIDEVRSHVRVRSLYFSCQLKVWRYCGYKLANTQNVELPWNIKNDLSNILSF